MAYVVMALIVMACKVMACTGMAYIPMAYIVMACILMAYIQDVPARHPGRSELARRPPAERIFFDSIPRSVPTVNAEGPCRSEGTSGRRLTKAFPSPPSDPLQPSACAEDVAKNRCALRRDYLCLIAGDCHIPGNPTASYCCCINATNETECAGGP